MKWVNVSDRMPTINHYYYCKIDTHRDNILKTIVECGRNGNGQMIFDIYGCPEWKEITEDAEVIEWLDENAPDTAKEILNQVFAISEHNIPFYAYGDNEAACVMDKLLFEIQELVANYLKS